MIRPALLAALLTARAASAQEGAAVRPPHVDPNSFGAEEVLSADRIALCSGLSDVTVETLRAVLASGIVGHRPITVVAGDAAEPIDGRTVWLVLDDRTLDPAVAACAAQATEFGPRMEAALKDQFGEGADERRLAEMTANNAFAAAVLTTPPYHATDYLYGDRDVVAVTFSALKGHDLRAEVTEGLFGLRTGTCFEPSACGF